jgi:hypothetical protein
MAMLMGQSYLSVPAMVLCYLNCCVHKFLCNFYTNFCAAWSCYAKIGSRDITFIV